MGFFLAQAPANIALVKYMGKDSGNIPANPSISMTLKKLCTYAEVELVETAQIEWSFEWVSELPRTVTQSYGLALALKEEEHERVLQHMRRVWNAMTQFAQNVGMESVARTREKKIILRTVNTFPHAAGLASSASSFAAMTLVLAIAWMHVYGGFDLEQHPSWLSFLSHLSSQGSGSSCRSFLGPWVLWNRQQIECLKVPLLSDMAHFVLCVQTQPKKVSSSQAHQRVLSSPLWQGRTERARFRGARMREALEQGQLKVVSQLAWQEAWEMHSLFHTAEPLFSYWEPETLSVLNWAASFLQEVDPPIVTMDAGPNVHFLVRAVDRDLWRERLSGLPYAFLEDEAGMGAHRLESHELERI